MKAYTYALIGLGVVLPSALFLGYLAQLQPIVAEDPVPEVFQQRYAGEQFTVPAQVGWWPLRIGGDNGLVAVGVKQYSQQTVDFCRQQVEDNGKASLLPIEIGQRWDALQAVINTRLQEGHLAHENLRNVLLDSASFDVPALKITGSLASGHFTLHSKAAYKLALLSDADNQGLQTLEPKQSKAFNSEAWLVWAENEATPMQDNVPGNNAIQLQRSALPGCSAGGLQVTLWTAPKPVNTAEAGVTLGNKWPWYAAAKAAGKTSGLAVFYLSSGKHSVPVKQHEQIEDRRLFENLLAAGLIYATDAGQLRVVPEDYPAARALVEGASPAESTLAHWHGLPWTANEIELQQDLYYSAAGSYVRAKIAEFNNEAQLAAVRLKAVNGAAENWLEKAAPRWQATVVNGPALNLTETMPLRAGSLFNTLPVGWQSWQRVAEWPESQGQNQGIALNLHTQIPASGSEQLQLMVVGEVQTIQGAKLLARAHQCLKSPCLPETSEAVLLTLQPEAKSQFIGLQVKPLVRQQLKAMYAAEARHIVVNGGQVRWQSLPQVKNAKQLAEVNVTDRQGVPLIVNNQLQAISQESGLAALLGGHPQQQGSMLNQLSRLGKYGLAYTDTQLTLDSTWQQFAQSSLQNGVSSSSEDMPEKYREQRKAALLLMNGNTGEILASASLPALPMGVNFQDVQGFESLNASASPMRIQGWQHNGDHFSLPGSTFKLVTSLLLEQEAEHNPTLAALLSGVDIKGLNQYGAAQGYSFTAQAACYPAIDANSQQCLWGNQERTTQKPVINNFGQQGVFYETPVREMQLHGDKLYGLEQALRDSLNTWFSWLLEMTDATLLGQGNVPGVPDSKALVPDALDQVRPLVPLMRRLGFGQTYDLSAGLFPADYRWQIWDVLRMMPSSDEAIEDRHQVRQTAIGLRTHVTPLNMAMVSAAIATGQLIKPRLIAALNGKEATLPDFESLGINTERIKAGMHRVLLDGTAKNAFKDQAYQGLREHLYAKTGTAPITLSEDGHKVSVNNAWFTGWLEAGTLEGIDYPVVFTCMLTHVTATGGESCGPIVREALLAITGQTQQSSPEPVKEIALGQ